MFTAIKTEPVYATNRSLWAVYEDGNKAGIVVTHDNVTEAGAVAKFLQERREDAEGQEYAERLHP